MHVNTTRGPHATILSCQMKMLPTLQIDLVALALLGPGDGNKRTAEYLLEMPLLGDLLEEALTQFGHSIEEFERPL